MSDTDTDTRPGRARIRDATALLLADAVPLAEGRVYSARVWPTATDALPDVLVYLLSETKTSTSRSTGAPAFRVEAQLVVQARAEAETAEALEIALDDLAGQVESGLLTDAAWVAQFEAISAVTTQIQTPAGGDKPVGQVAITFAVEWSEDFPPNLPHAFASVRLTAAAPALDLLIETP